jgi:hypothetical protein
MDKRKLISVGIGLAVMLVAWVIRDRIASNAPIDIDEPTYLNTSLLYTDLMRQWDIKGIAWVDDNIEHPIFAKLLVAAALLPTHPIDQIQEKDLLFEDPVQLSHAKTWLLPGRKVSVVFGSLSAGVLAVFNPAAGIALALQTSSIRYSSELYLEAVPLLTSLLSVLTYGIWVRKMEVSSGGRTWGWLGISSIMLGLTAASKYMYCIAGVAVLVHMLWRALRRRDISWQERLLTILGWGGLAFFVFFAADPILWPRPIRRLTETLQYHITFASGSHVEKYHYPFWQTLSWLSRSAFRPEVYAGDITPISLDLPILLLAVLGLWRLAKEYPEFFIWLIIGVIFLMLWKAKWLQYVMVLMVPFCLSAGMGVKTLWSWVLRLPRGSIRSYSKRPQ